MNVNNETILKNDIAAVNIALEKLDCLSKFGGDAQKVLVAERYAVLAGGKRIRPVLCMEFYKLFGGCGDILQIACCLELMHTFSLIHDDMPEMDNDLMRRGKPSVHAKFGSDVALLAGDGLCILPFEIISKSAIDNKISFETAARLINCLAESAGNSGMIMGQMLDIVSECKDVDSEFLTEMSAKKTGCLLKASCKFGAILAGADEKMLESAETYAENLGLAFQIVDDILDVIGDEKKLGKPVGSDRERDKRTFADVLGIEKAYELARQRTSAAVDAIIGYEGSEFLCELAVDLIERNN